MKKLLGFLIVLSNLLLMLPIRSVTPDPIACFNDLQINFYQENIVHQALSLYNIPQGLWSPISFTLKTTSFQIPERMRKITARMVPNPIEFPMQRAAASEILKKVLKDVLYETLTKYQVNERPRADFIFDYIFTKQLPKFIYCFGEEAKLLAPSFD
jgi:hypothetical protein